MSDNVIIGNASQLVNDDIARDVNMQRVPPLGHKTLPEIGRDPSIMYGGHPIWKEKADTYIATLKIARNNTTTSVGVTGATTRVDVSAFIPPGLEPVGLISAVQLQYEISGAKTKETTIVSAHVQYSLTYDDTPGVYNRLAYIRAQGQSSDADNYWMRGGNQSMAFCPLVYKGKVPYIVWNLIGNWNNMTGSSNPYEVEAFFFLMGYLK